MPEGLIAAGGQLKVTRVGRRKRHSRSHKRKRNHGYMTKYVELKQLSIKDLLTILSRNRNVIREIMKQTTALVPLLELIENHGEDIPSPQLLEQVWKSIAKLMHEKVIESYDLIASSTEYGAVVAASKRQKVYNEKPANWRNIAVHYALLMSEEYALRSNAQELNTKHIESINDKNENEQKDKLEIIGVSTNIIDISTECSNLLAKLPGCKNKKSWALVASTDKHQFIRQLERITCHNKNQGRPYLIHIYQCNICGRSFHSATAKTTHLEYHIQLKSPAIRSETSAFLNIPRKRLLQLALSRDDSRRSLIETTLNEIPLLNHDDVENLLNDNCSDETNLLELEYKLPKTLENLFLNILAYRESSFVDGDKTVRPLANPPRAACESSRGCVICFEAVPNNDCVFFLEPDSLTNRKQIIPVVDPRVSEQVSLTTTINRHNFTDHTKYVIENDRGVLPRNVHRIHSHGCSKVTQIKKRVNVKEELLVTYPREMNYYTKKTCKKRF